MYNRLLVFLMLNIVRYNLNALRTFVIVADAGSFSKAANRLAVTQGAVSQQIARLEEYLGTPLFERLPKNLQLTPQGLRLLRGVQSSIERIDGVVESARSHRTHEVLSVSSLASYAAKRLAPRLPDFERLNPSIRIQCETSPTLVNFGTMELDLAIRASNGMATWEGLQSIELYEDRIYPVTTPRYAKTLDEYDGLQRFVQTPLFYDLDSPDEWVRWFSQVGLAADPNLARGFSDLLVCIAALLSGAPGISLIGESMIEQELAEGALVRLSDVPLQPSRHYYLVYPANKTLSGAAAEFADWLCAVER